MTLAGRKEEAAIMRGLLQSRHSEFLALHGRRRAGKTFLIAETYRQEMVFELSGATMRPCTNTWPILPVSSASIANNL